MDLKDKIIKAAYKLFAEKGFEKTTVNEIIHAAGASKGGFYHHFETKDAVLEAITIKLTDDVLNRYHEITASKFLSAIDEFNSVFITINQAKTESIKKWNEYAAIFSFSESHIFIRKMVEYFEKVNTDLYEGIINKGIKNGIFHTNHPRHLAGMWTREILRIYTMVSHIILEDGMVSDEEFTSLLDFSERLINRELGTVDEIKVKEPALDFIDKTKRAYIKYVGGNADD